MLRGCVHTWRGLMRSVLLLHTRSPPGTCSIARRDLFFAYDRQKPHTTRMLRAFQIFVHFPFEHVKSAAHLWASSVSWAARLKMASLGFWGTGPDPGNVETKVHCSFDTVLWKVRVVLSTGLLFSLVRWLVLIVFTDDGCGAGTTGTWHVLSVFAWRY